MNIWKKCNENIPIKNTESVDGEKWEKYYSNLFSNNNSGNGIKVNSKTNSTQKKISNEHLILINKLINCVELKKILKLSKSGKSPGIDRISNEMLKHSFPVLKDCFVKLFN